MKVNPWTFGGLFLLVSCIWMWNNFELPKFYPFEKVGKVNAVVYQTKFVSPRLPHGGFDQIVHFIYKIDTMVYLSKYRAHRFAQFGRPGDSLLIQYSLSNPNRTDPIFYYHNISSKPRYKDLRKSFLHTKSNGFKVLDLRENIFTYEDYGEYGNRLIKTTGTYVKKNNVIQLSPLIYYVNRKIGATGIEEPKVINNESEKIFLSDFIDNPDGTIREKNSNLIFEIKDKK